MDPQDVIFDLDGTLVDSLPGIEYAVDQALQATGRAPRKSSLRALIGPPIRQILSKTTEETDALILDTLEHAFRQSYDAEGWTKTTLNPGAKETLAWLKQTNRRAYLVTNKPKQATTQILQKLELTEAFTQVRCRADLPVRSRPPGRLGQDKPALLQALMNTQKIAAHSAIMVGDTQEDLNAAHQAGIPVAILRTGYGNFHSSLSAPSCYFLNELSELRSIFERPGGIR